MKMFVLLFKNAKHANPYTFSKIRSVLSLMRTMWTSDKALDLLRLVTRSICSSMYYFYTQHLWETAVSDTALRAYTWLIVHGIRTLRCFSNLGIERDETHLNLLWYTNCSRLSTYFFPPLGLICCLCLWKYSKKSQILKIWHLCRARNGIDDIVDCMRTKKGINNLTLFEDVPLTTRRALSP